MCVIIDILWIFLLWFICLCSLLMVNYCVKMFVSCLFVVLFDCVIIFVCVRVCVCICDVCVVFVMCVLCWNICVFLLWWVIGWCFFVVGVCEWCGEWWCDGWWWWWGESVERFVFFMLFDVGRRARREARRRRGWMWVDVVSGGRCVRVCDGVKCVFELWCEGGGEEGENELDEEDGAATRGDGSTFDASFEYASDVGWRIVDGDVNCVFDEVRCG